MQSGRSPRCGDAVSGWIPHNDQPSLMQAFNRLVQTRALRQVDDLILAPELRRCIS